MIGEKFSATSRTMLLTIAKCESKLKPKAQNPDSTADGVFQIIDGTWKAYRCKGDKLNAEDNINCAAKIYKAEGVTAWNASRACWDDSL